MDYPYDAAVAEAFLARVFRRERINDLLDRPGMPSQRAYRHWRRTHAGFQARLAGLRELRYAGGRTHPRWRAFDEAVADRMLLRVWKGEPWRRMLETDPEMPCRVVVYRWRQQQPDWDRALKVAMRAGRLVRERTRTAEACAAASERIGKRIALRGKSLRSLAGERGMPSARTLYKWRALFPDFAAKVADAYDFRDWMAADRRMAESPIYAELLREMTARMDDSGGVGPVSEV